MYKITYIPTGHTFLLPDDAAKKLKSEFPDDYKIIEKNGKKFRDVVRKRKTDDGTIYSKVVEKE